MAPEHAAGAQAESRAASPPHRDGVLGAALESVPSLQDIFQHLALSREPSLTERYVNSASPECDASSATHFDVLYDSGAVERLVERARMRSLGEMYRDELKRAWQTRTSLVG